MVAFRDDEGPAKASAPAGGPSAAKGIWLWAAVLAWASFEEYAKLNRDENETLASHTGQTITNTEWWRMNSHSHQFMLIAVLAFLPVFIICIYWYRLSKSVPRRSIILQLLGFPLFGFGSLGVLIYIVKSLDLSFYLVSPSPFFDVSLVGPGLLSVILIVSAYFLVFRERITPDRAKSEQENSR